MIRPFSAEAARKIDPCRDFFDFSAVFGRTPALPLVRLLYPTRITPPQVSLAALAAGAAAALSISRGGHGWLIVGALLLQLKNVLDTVDGHLARARSRPSSIGRYLDSLVDFLVNILVHVGLGMALSGRGYSHAIWVWVGLASLSTLFQCSYYVFYTVRYLEIRGKGALSRSDERPPPDPERACGPEAGFLLPLLHRLHLLLYGWQDDAVRRLDRWWFERCLRRSPAGRGPVEGEARTEAGGPPAPLTSARAAWYTDRRVLSWTSGLGLGTQLALMSLALLAGRPALYLWLVLAGGNVYLVMLMSARCVMLCRGERGREE